MKLLAPVTSLVLAAIPFILRAQGVWCYPQARLVIFSNYDGGRLTINVDEDIPDLHIGVVSYEFARIGITGPYAGNVAAVHYAGYDGDSDHCNTGGVLTTSVLGVPPSIVSINFAPPASIGDSFGWPSIICGYSCEEGQDQGGCNTAQQVTAYFQSLWGLAPRFHRTQYDCWEGDWFISQGGNCCAGALSTGLDPVNASRSPLAWSSGDQLLVNEPGAFQLIDALGRVVLRDGSAAVGSRSYSTAMLPAGTYNLLFDDGRVMRMALQR